MLKKLIVVIGTRPEAIKMAPVVHAIQDSNWAKCEVVLTGQHRDLVLPLLNHFQINHNADLECMTENQSLASVTARIIEKMDLYLSQANPDALLVQGDTLSVLGSSLVSFFRKIPIGHVEAGLRTGVIDNPFPEEMNRVLATKLAKWHFAPTHLAEKNLLSESVSRSKVWVTGNTVIDALKWTLNREYPVSKHEHQGRPFILVTAHRRENFGQGMKNIFSAIKELANSMPDYDFVIPLHPNPKVHESAQILRFTNNILLTSPSPYPEFCRLMAHAKLILSDSGGVQEEAPALGIPVLVLRNETERPEAISLGSNMLVGTDPNVIIGTVKHLLADQAAYEKMATAGSPYGDGSSAQQIASILEQELS